MSNGVAMGVEGHVPRAQPLGGGKLTFNQQILDQSFHYPWQSYVMFAVKEMKQDKLPRKQEQEEGKDTQYLLFLLFSSFSQT